jgi:predicted transcriptional regulator
MDIVYELGRASAAEVHERLPDAPSYSAVRALLRVLEDKGHLRHEHDGPRYAYLPTTPREKARESAMRRVVRTFFDGSTEGAVAALLDLDGNGLDDDAIARIRRRLEEVRREES